MVTKERAASGGSPGSVPENLVDSTTDILQLRDSCDRDKGESPHDDDGSYQVLSHVSATDSSSSSSNHATERDCPHTTLVTKKSAAALVREESCFRMIELAEALAVVDSEVRSAVQIQLRNHRLSRASQMKTPMGQNGESLQATQPHGSSPEEARSPRCKCSEAQVSCLHQAGTEELGGKRHNTPLLGVDLGLNEDCLVETIAPPFIGRRVGAPEGVIAPFALPPFRASLVDGYALHIPSGKWREVQELYRVKCSREQVKLDVEHAGDDRVALKIAGEVRAGANLTGETVQPFRGHPHILAEMRGAGPGDSRGRCCPKNQTEQRYNETRHGAVPTALQCVYVTTGSPVPQWCNAVIPVENCEVDVDECVCWPDHEVVSKIHGTGENIREVGTDAPARSPLMQQGQLVGPAEEGMLAAVGLEKLDVFRRLNVHTLAIGDELQSRVAARTPESGDCSSAALQCECGRCRRHMAEVFPACCISDNKGEPHMATQNSVCWKDEEQTANCARRAAVYDSNSPMLSALLSQHCPSTRVGQQHVLPDDVDEVQRLLVSLALKEQTIRGAMARDTQSRSQPLSVSERGQHGRCVDVLVSTGGVSMGGSDCMKLALLQLQRKSVERHQCGKINLRDKELLTIRGEQNRSNDRTQLCCAAADSGDRTNTSTGNAGTTLGHEIDTGGKSVTTSPTSRVPSVTEKWSYTVETEIKFGRLNVKPGKPTIFAVLRVFRQNAADAASLELSAEQRQHTVQREEAPRWTAARHANNENDSVSKSALTSPGRAPRSRDMPHGKLLSTTLTSNEVKQPLSSSEKPPDWSPPRSPLRVLLVFALPGNPCSAWVLFHLLVAPALNLYSSFCPCTSLLAHVPAPTLACLDEPVVPDTLRPEYHRALVYVEHSKDKPGPWDYNVIPRTPNAQSSAGGWTTADHALRPMHAFPTGRQASSRLLSCCASANGLILVAPSTTSKRACIAAGETVRILLCGTPFPVRPDPLIRLLRQQNKLTGFHLAKCRCDGDKEAPKDVRTTEGGQWQITSTTDPMVHTGGPEGEAPPCKVPSARIHVDADESTTSHFSCERALSETVKLGIVIVSDRCFRGEMQDACAETLLKVLRSSKVVAALLQLNCQQTHGSVSAARATDGDFPEEGHKWDRVKEHSGRLRIVPDVIENIQDAVLSMLCACARDPNKRMHLGADGSIARRSVIFVCGGTGLSARDVTPQAVLPLFTVRCNGIEHLLLEHSLRCTPLAALGRPCAGVMECPASRQLTEGHRNTSFVNGGICQPTTDSGTCFTCGLSQKCCGCTVSSAADAPQGFEGVVADECCCPRALQDFIDSKAMATCQEVLNRGKDAVDGRTAVASTPVLTESRAVWARGLVDADKRKFSRRSSGCGARGMVMVFPGSPKAVRELAEALLAVLPHALEQFST